MSLNTDQVRHCVSQARWAPSGDNCQPWALDWDGQILSITHLPKRGDHPLNPKGLCSLLALVALIESLHLAASEFSHRAVAEFATFATHQESCWARVQFVSDAQGAHPLAGSLAERRTDRRLYKGGEINDEFISHAVGNAFSESAQIHFCRGFSEPLRAYILDSEKLMVDHDALTMALLEWTRFSRAEAERTRDGMLWTNLGLHWWELPSVKLIQAFPSLLKLAKPVLMGQHMDRVGQQLHSSAGAVCVSVKSSEPSAIINAGRLMLRAWLELNQKGYGVQPMTIGSAISYATENGWVSHDLSPKWSKRLQSGQSILRTAFKIPPDSHPLWMIRTGRSSPLPDKMRTLRRSVDDILKIRNVPMETAPRAAIGR